MTARGTELVDEDQQPALHILRRAVRESPELRRGLGVTVVFALLSALARLVLPILVQQTLDGGFTEGAVDVGFVFRATLAAGALIVVIYGLTTITYRRVIAVAENTLLALRVRTFDHIQRLSLAEHTEKRKGVLTARVTSDVVILARFAQWGALAWIVDTALIIGTLALMAVYSWQLALLTVGYWCAGVRVDNLRIKMIFPDSRTIFTFNTLVGNARAHDFRQSVDVYRMHIKRFFDFLP